MTNHLQIHNWSTLHKCCSYEQLNYWISAFDSLCQPAKFFYICLSMHTLYLSGCALRFVTREGYPRGEVDRQGSQSSLFLIYILLFSLSSILLFYDSPFSFFSHVQVCDQSHVGLHTYILPLFQNVCRFNFFRIIYFVMYIDICIYLGA